MGGVLEVGGGGHFLHPVEDFEISSKKQMECVFQHNLNYLAKKKSSHTHTFCKQHIFGSLLTTTRIVCNFFLFHLENSGKQIKIFEN